MLLLLRLRCCLLSTVFHSVILHDTLELVYTIDRFQLGNGTRWLENWERVWADNLQTCVDGMCEVRLS